LPIIFIFKCSSSVEFCDTNLKCGSELKFCDYNFKIWEIIKGR